MGIKTRVRSQLEALAVQFGYRLLPEQSLYEWQKRPGGPQRSARPPLPEGAAAYLVRDNPRMRELKERYAGFDKDVTTPLVWSEDVVSAEDMLQFRGDNAYVWQTRSHGMNILAYALTTYYAKSIDRLGLFDRLSEDGLFGAHTFSIDQRLISRDLLDSIIEMNFLEKHLGISSRADLKVLDIGAGYGRLAYRMATGLPNLATYLCTDAFPVSTFLSEYHLRFRKVEEKTTVVPLDEIQGVMEQHTVILAVNIHSFSECRPSAINWWLTLLERSRVQYLMIVPNPPELQTNDGVDFSGIIEQHGYRLIAREPKYSDPVLQEYGVNRSNYYLFERRG